MQYPFQDLDGAADHFVEVPRILLSVVALRYQRLHKTPVTRRESDAINIYVIFAELNVILLYRGDPRSSDLPQVRLWNPPVVCESIMFFLFFSNPFLEMTSEVPGLYETSVPWDFFFAQREASII